MRILTNVVMICVISVFSIFAVDAAYGGVSNSCVKCHLTLKNKGNSLINLNAHNWEDSIHRKAGVDCQACHGGNPSKFTKAEAHIGVFKPGNPKSTVYYKNIPSTCGKCHVDEFQSFKQSYHYKHLEEIGNGPNCITCHGAMATHVLHPGNIANTCKNCHNYRLAIDPSVPKKAEMMLLMLSEGRLLINRYAADYKTSHTAEPVSFRKADENFNKAIKSWHSFDFDKTTSYILSMYGDLKEIK